MSGWNMSDTSEYAVGIVFVEWKQIKWSYASSMACMMSCYVVDRSTSVWNTSDSPQFTVGIMCVGWDCNQIVLHERYDM